MTYRPPGAGPTRVMLVDGRASNRAALAVLLDAEPDITVVAAAETAAAALQQLATHAPHVAVIDHHPPDSTSIALCKHIRTLAPSTRCIIHANTDLDLEPPTGITVVLKHLDTARLTAAIREHR